MACLPSFEEILTKVHLGLGLGKLDNKKRFTGYKMEISGHVDQTMEMLNGIYKALELDALAREDATTRLEMLNGILKTLELKTWTGDASPQQVMWHLLASVHVPVWARNLAFWSLENVERDLPPIDAGMPGGEFWFLPFLHRETGKMQMPLAKVLDWLIDLLDAPSLTAAATALAGDSQYGSEIDPEALVRKLRYWATGKTPHPGEIEALFPDSAAMAFPGAWALPEEMAPDAQFESALAFVIDRKLSNAEQLAGEIPMTAERLCPIFDRSASSEEKEIFVRNIAIRYAAPDMATVRQRLRVARLVQDGYQELLSFLCPDLLPEQQNDPRHNKVLQLLALFETIYNKTIEAWHHGNTDVEQDAWFEADLDPVSHYELLAILSSFAWQERIDLLAKRLTRRFLSLAPEQGLEDILAANEEYLGAVLRPRVERIRSELQEEQRLPELLERVRAASPYRALQSESSFWVLSQFAQHFGLTEKIRTMALDRLSEVAATPLERGSVKLLVLGFILNGEGRSWPKGMDVRGQVRQLLEVAEADAEAWEAWKAPFLRFTAKHALSENRLGDAERHFKAALDACSERSFGGVRGEIAKDGFAVAIARTPLNKNHQLYYKNMIHFTEHPTDALSFENAAAECEEFFWSDLYRPYPGLDPLANQSMTNFKQAFSETFGLIETADWNGLRDWMSSNKRLFRSNLKDARKNSVLMLWIKLLYDRRFASLWNASETTRQHVKNRREAIRLLLELWPEQAKMTDFKGQTPLMLAADNGDAELTLLLAPFSEIDAQDYLGRTALHAAVAGRSVPCLEIILDRNPDVLKVSEREENTALHTAVRFGWLSGCRLIVESFPGLTRKTNTDGQTPHEMASEILTHYEEWRDFMRRAQKRRIGSENAIREIVTLFGSVSA